MNEGDVENLLNGFRDAVSVESKHDIVEDGLYKGCIISYANGLTLMHPYIPLMATGSSGQPISVFSSSIQTRYGSIEMKNGYPVYNDMLISELDNSDPAS